jgi:serine/threonine-protein kinase
MWSRTFPGLVLVVAASAVLVLYGDGSPSEIRLAASGVAILMLIAAGVAWRSRDRAIVPDTTHPATSIVRANGPTHSPRTINYQIVKKLASGGMGEVFLAWQHGPRTFRRNVVLKRLHARFSTEPRVVDMFLNEAQLAAELSHPNIVPIHELYQDTDGSYVLVMEYVCGPTLLSVLRERNRRGAGLPYGPMIRIASAVCDALEHAYASPGPDGLPRRIIHRDISPSNIMLRYDGEVKLLDFGLAKVTGGELVDESTVTGKLGYMSPEQLCNEVLDHRTDVFSLGIVLWEMATGKRLFRRDTDSQMIHAILRAPIPSLRQLSPTMDPDLDAIVARALARDRRVRYNDAATLARDLRSLAGDRGWSRRREDLVALAREADLNEVPIISGDAIVAPIEHEHSQATDVVSQDVEFTVERSPQTIEHTAILPKRGGSQFSDWHTPV